MMSFAATAIVYTCHFREGGVFNSRMAGHPWTLAFAGHSGGFQQPNGWSSRNQLLALSSSQRKLGSILPLLLLLKIKSVSSATRPSSFLLISVTARTGARANGEAGPEGVSAMDGANQRNEPKKSAFPDEAAPAFYCYQDFSTRHPRLGRKTAHILCAALRVFRSCRHFGIFRSEKQNREAF